MDNRSPGRNLFHKMISSLNRTTSYLLVGLLPVVLFTIGYLTFPYLRIYFKKPVQVKVSKVGDLYGTKLPGSDYLLPETVKIDAASFEMGSETGDADEMPVHKVTLQAFEIARFEITNAQWKSYCDARNLEYPTNPKSEPNYFLAKPNHPVINISWIQAKEYCHWLTELTGRQYRLPTEAEWEYAADDSTIGRNANNITAASPSTAEVGSYQPNSHGLYDMLGNVWEWCEDWYDPRYFKRSVENDPVGPESGKFRVLRGGCWGDPPVLCRKSNRIQFHPYKQYGFYGFRIAISGLTQVSQSTTK